MKKLMSTLRRVFLFLALILLFSHRAKVDIHCIHEYMIATWVVVLFAIDALASGLLEAVLYRNRIFFYDRTSGYALLTLITIFFSETSALACLEISKHLSFVVCFVGLQCLSCILTVSRLLISNSKKTS